MAATAHTTTRYVPASLAAVEQALAIANARFIKEGAGFSYGRVLKEIATLEAERDRIERELEERR